MHSRILSALAITAAVIFGLSAQAQALTAYALTNTNGLVQFDTATPANVVLAIDHIGGLVANDDLIGIDFRPADGQLYAVGTGGGTAGSARVYTINPLSGQATLVSTMDTSLNGSRYGFDFNPVADRLRIVSNANQNLRVNVTTGVTLTDTPVSYAAGDIFAGQDPNIVGSAYTNNFAGATTTTLYGIDTVRNALVIQNPPNAGTLTTVGLLGVDASQLVGFDIFTDLSSGTNVGYAVLQNIAEGISRFYTIDLNTGQATQVGLEMGDLLDGLAIVPEPSSLVLIGIGLVATAGAAWSRRRASR
ncbi:MAG: hypothetical protein QOG48_2445 [Verrucomicrobiota bacterium]